MLTKVWYFMGIKPIVKSKWHSCSSLPSTGKCTQQRPIWTLGLLCFLKTMIKLTSIIQLRENVSRWELISFQIWRLKSLHLFMVLEAFKLKKRRVYIWNWVKLKFKMSIHKFKYQISSIGTKKERLQSQVIKVAAVLVGLLLLLLQWNLLMQLDIIPLQIDSLSNTWLIAIPLITDAEVDGCWMPTSSLKNMD